MALISVLEAEVGWGNLEFKANLNSDQDSQEYTKKPRLAGEGARTIISSQHYILC